MGKKFTRNQREELRELLRHSGIPSKIDTNEREDEVKLTVDAESPHELDTFNPIFRAYKRTDGREVNYFVEDTPVDGFQELKKLLSEQIDRKISQYKESTKDEGDPLAQSGYESFEVNLSRKLEIWRVPQPDTREADEKRMIHGALGQSSVVDELKEKGATDSNPYYLVLRKDYDPKSSARTSVKKAYDSYKAAKLYVFRRGGS